MQLQESHSPPGKYDQRFVCGGLVWNYFYQLLIITVSNLCRDTWLRPRIAACAQTICPTATQVYVCRPPANHLFSRPRRRHRQPIMRKHCCMLYLARITCNAWHSCGWLLQMEWCGLSVGYTGTTFRDWMISLADWIYLHRTTMSVPVPQLLLPSHSCHSYSRLSPATSTPVSVPLSEFLSVCCQVLCLRYGYPFP